MKHEFLCLRNCRGFGCSGWVESEVETIDTTTVGRSCKPVLNQEKLFQKDTSRDPSKSAYMLGRGLVFFSSREGISYREIGKTGKLSISTLVSVQAKALLRHGCSNQMLSR